MDYKVLIKLIVPELDKNYEVYIPINKTVGEVCHLLNKLINEISSDAYPIKNNIALCNRFSFETYDYNAYVRDTDIRNGSQLVFFG